MTAKPDKELLGQIERLITQFQPLVKEAEGSKAEESFVYGLRALVCLAGMILREDDVFGIEAWHSLSSETTLIKPVEMLLRLQTFQGKPMPPYPAIMAFYNNGFTAGIDSILFLAGLQQFQRHIKKQGKYNTVSINISARSLRDPEFVRITMDRLEILQLKKRTDRKIIIEIHESTPHLTLSRQILALYKNLGVSFAIDDVGLNMDDIMRLSEFEGMTEYIKIDRHAVNSPEKLRQTMSFITTIMPEVHIIAEGVKTPEQALKISQDFPDIHYVQGRSLPESHETFALAYYNAKAAQQRTKET